MAAQYIEMEGEKVGSTLLVDIVNHQYYTHHSANR